MVTLDTGLGTIEGLEHDGVLEFRGIRYAEPPIGERRFRPPVRTGGWDGTFDATSWGCRSVQSPPPGELGGSGPGEIGEDCLIVNVTTPAGAVADGARGASGSRPVFVWIHGGAFTIGSANDYPAHGLVARDDIVVVTVNYRLGALGWLDLSGLDPSYAGSASNGIRDQVAALEWVRDNIADFGGDPDQVTIGGESAGAISVLMLLASPAADGLYHRAMVNSAGGLRPGGTDLTPLVDPHVPGDGPLLDRILAATPDQLLASQLSMGFALGSNLDGTVVTRTIDEAVTRAAGAGVPLLIGSNADEGTLFLAIAGGDADIFDLMSSSLTTAIAGAGNEARYLELLAETRPDEDRTARNLRVWNEFFRRPAVDSATLATEHGPGGWLYLFRRASDLFDGVLGACHAGEIAFTFDWLSGGAEDLSWSFHSPTPENRAVAATWSQAVTRFIRTGDPNGGDLPEWPRYAADDRSVLVVDAPITVAVDPDEDARKLWAQL